MSVATHITVVFYRKKYIKNIRIKPDGKTGRNNMDNGSVVFGAAF